MNSQTSVREFVGVRCNLQRFSDCKVFYGWVDSFDGKRLGLRIRMSAPFIGGEEFHVELHGKENRMVGRFVSTAPDPSEVTIAEAISFLGDGVGGSSSHYCRFEVRGECKLAPVIENFRVATSGLAAKLGADGITYDCWISDVSDGGMGIDLKRNCAIDESVELFIPFRSTEIHLTATVRSISSSNVPEAHRIGLQIAPVDRVEAAKWSDFVKQSLGE